MKRSRSYSARLTYRARSGTHVSGGCGQPLPRARPRFRKQAKFSALWCPTVSPAPAHLASRFWPNQRLAGQTASRPRSIDYPCGVAPVRTDEGVEGRVPSRWPGSLLLCEARACCARQSRASASGHGRSLSLSLCSARTSSRLRRRQPARTLRVPCCACALRPERLQRAPWTSYSESSVDLCRSRPVGSVYPECSPRGRPSAA